MSREQLAFLSGGVVFGFVLGFVVAWGIGHAPETPMRAAMPQRGAPPSAPTDDAPAPPGERTMEEVTGRLDELKSRIEQNPEDVEALIELANLYMQVNMYDRAQEYLEQAVQVDPDDLHAGTHLGIVLGQLGDLDGARARFQRTVELNPDYWEGWFYLAVTTARQGDLETARRATERVEELNPGLPELADLRQHFTEADQPGS